MWAHFLTHWKTTVQGILSFVIISAITLQLALAQYVQPSPLEIKIGIILNVTLAMAKGILAYFQKDAGVVTAVLPSTGIPTAMASHETPDNPAAKPIVGK